MVRADDPQIDQQTRQQRATVELARQLVAEVLDVQIMQFSDNGLNTLPVFSDIQQMRTTLDHVTEEEMHIIIDLLKQAQRASNQQQTELLGLARTNARKVVSTLMAERERLRQRLKVAHLQAQLKQLIDQQQRVRADTQQLHTTPSDQRDRATLSTLESQRDAHILFEQLTASLATVQQWENEQGKAAADSTRQLQANNVEQLFSNAESDLAKGAIDRAQQHQTNIIEHLTAVLDKLEASQGLQPFDPASTLKQVRAVLQAQQQLTDTTRDTDANDLDSLDQLSQEQSEIRKQLSDIDSPGNELAGGQHLLQQATTAATQAEGDLFEGDQDAALKQQQEIISNLKQLEELLRIADSMSPSSEATDPVLDQVEQLEQLGQNLGQIAKQQDQVVADVDSAPEAAQERQQEVADDLAQETQRPALPQDLEQAVQNAADLAKQAAKTLQNESSQSGAAPSEAAKGVQQAIQAAQARAAARLQAARSAMQQANAPTQMPTPPSDSGQPSPGDRQGASQAARSGAKLDAPARLSNSDLADSQATSSRRTAGDAQRVDSERAAIEARSYAEAPWFARLPPELREAIRMRGRPRPPRGYEERLRRYFESVDK